MTDKIPEDDYNKYCFEVPHEINGAWIREQYDAKKMMSVNDLVDGSIYAGHCRNSPVAIWIASLYKFIYLRSKFGCTFLEDIDHVETDTSYDVFVPHYLADERYSKLTDELKEGLKADPDFISGSQERQDKWGSDKRIDVPCT